MKFTRTLLAAGALLGAANLPAFGLSTLAEYAFNIDGIVADSLLGDPLPSSVNLAGFDTASGLGSILVTLGGTGAHYGAVFLDHEIDQTLNTWFNELGSVNGTRSAGQSWEIDEPGWGAGPGTYSGDIYTNLVAGTLDNSIGTPNPNDVSMALGWGFNLNPGETALLRFNVSQTSPNSGFYLIQTDPASNQSIYFSSSLALQGQSVPDSGSSLVLLLGAMAGLAGWRSVRTA